MLCSVKFEELLLIVDHKWFMIW